MVYYTMNSYYAYVTNYGSSNVSMYAIDSSTGILSVLSTAIGSGYDPNSITVIAIPILTPTPVSDICFPAGTPIQTDQGLIMIDKINPAIHTIRNKIIADITKTITADNFLVGFKKNALGFAYPTSKTLMSKNHKVYYQGKMRKAKTFLGHFEKVIKVKYTGEILYNVLMDDYTTLRANNLICETLHPANIVAKLYTKKCKYTAEERDKIVVVLKECLQRKDYKTYNKIAQCC